MAFTVQKSAASSFSSCQGVLHNQIACYDGIQAANESFLAGRKITIEQVDAKKDEKLKKILLTMVSEMNLFTNSTFSNFQERYRCRQLLHKQYEYKFGLNGSRIRMIPPVRYSLEKTPIALVSLAAKLASLEHFSVQNFDEYKEVLIHCFMQQQLNISDIGASLLLMAQLVECNSLEQENSFPNQLELFCQSAGHFKDHYLPSTNRMITEFARLRTEKKILTDNIDRGSKKNFEKPFAEKLHQLDESLVLLFADAAAQFQQVSSLFSSVYFCCYQTVFGAARFDTPRPHNSLAEQIASPQILFPDDFATINQAHFAEQKQTIFSAIESWYHHFQLGSHIGKSASASSELDPIPIVQKKKVCSLSQITCEESLPPAAITVLMPPCLRSPSSFQVKDGPDSSIRFSRNCAQLYKPITSASDFLNCPPIAKKYTCGDQSAYLLPTAVDKIRSIGLSLIPILSNLGDVTRMTDGEDHIIEKIYSLFGEIISRDGGSSKKGTFAYSFNIPLAAVTDVYFAPAQSFYEVLNSHIRYHGSSYQPNPTPLPSEGVSGTAVYLPDDGSRITRIDVRSGIVEVIDPKNSIIFSVFSSKLR